MTFPVTTSPVVLAVGDAITAALPADVAVLDAIDIQQDYLAKSVTFGGLWDPDTGQMSTTDAVTVETTEHGLGRLVTETTHVACVAFATVGAAADNRTAVNDILTAVRGALRGISVVGTSSARAQMATQQWAQVTDGQGSGLLATFEVTVEVLP